MFSQSWTGRTLNLLVPGRIFQDGIEGSAGYCCIPYLAGYNGCKPKPTTLQMARVWLVYFHVAMFMWDVAQPSR